MTKILELSYKDIKTQKYSNNFGQTQLKEMEK